jgi:hypothetical protein
MEICVFQLNSPLDWMLLGVFLSGPRNLSSPTFRATWKPDRFSHTLCQLRLQSYCSKPILVSPQVASVLRLTVLPTGG